MLAQIHRHAAGRVRRSTAAPRFPDFVSPDFEVPCHCRHDSPRAGSGTGRTKFRYVYRPSLEPKPASESVPSQNGTLPPLEVKGRHLVALETGFDIGAVACPRIAASSGFEDISTVQPTGAFGGTYISGIAGSGVAGQLLYHARFHGIAVYVARELTPVGLGIDQHRLVTAAKQRTIPTRRAVVVLGIDAINVAHDPLQIAGRGAQEQVIVVVHQTVRVPVRIKALRRIAQQGQKIVAMIIACENRTPRGTPVHHVIPGARVFDTERPRHAKSIAYITLYY